jgi:hypothetical protein
LFDEPPFGQSLEAWWCLGITLHDFKVNAALLLNLPLKVLSCETLISEDDLQLLSPRLTFDLNESG